VQELRLLGVEQQRRAGACSARTGLLPAWSEGHVEESPRTRAGRQAEAATSRTRAHGHGVGEAKRWGWNREAPPGESRSVSASSGSPRLRSGAATRSSACGAGAIIFREGRALGEVLLDEAKRRSCRKPGAERAGLLTSTFRALRTVMRENRPGPSDLALGRNGRTTGRRTGSRRLRMAR